MRQNIDTIKQIIWYPNETSTIDPRTGFVPREMVHSFEYQGYEYFIRQRTATTWLVCKCVPMRGSSAEYIVTKGRSKLNCDCPSGQRNLLCRHKEMVTMSIALEDISVIEVTKKKQEAQDRALQEKQRLEMNDALKNANSLLEKFKEMKNKMRTNNAS